MAIVALGVAFMPEAASGGGGRYAPPVRFGMDSGSIKQQADFGVLPDYAVVWAGPWLPKHGWGGFDATLQKAYDRGVTPAIHFYYWGNDISKDCILNGCWSDTHNVWKDQAGWDQLASGLVNHIKTTMNGRPVMIILETEFNKGDVSAWEGLDQRLSAKAGYFKWAYKPSQVVLGLGNWGSAQWYTWDRAAGASDFVGLQGMRAYTRHDDAQYYGVVQETRDGADKVKRLFGKPIVLTDIALGSYKHVNHVEDQAAVLQRFFDRLGDLKADGVRVFIYRAMYDNPDYNVNEYFGPAEATWGLIRADGEWKPAMQVWRQGVWNERANAVDIVEGERFDHRPVGGKGWHGGASADQFWNLWANGKMRQDVDLPQGGTYALKIRAMGEEARTVAPHMVVRVDGNFVFKSNPSDDGWRIYGGTFTVKDPGWHRVTIEFTNDGVYGNEDRNLWIDRLAVRRA
jgi:hypothetical protein